MITLKQITYALAVGKTLHFKNAADACSVSPSALSTALTELEKQLGIQVFERDNKKVLVTPMGKQFLEKASRLKLQVDDLQQMAIELKQPLSTPMSMGLIPTIAPYLLPKVLPELRAQYPNLKLHIIEEQSHVLSDLVKSGELDTAVLALPFMHDRLLAFEFWEEDFYWVTHCRDAHANQREIKSDDLKRERLLLLKDGHCLKDQALAACKFESTETGDALSSTSLNTLIQMVAGKMGTTLVPEMALDQLINNSTELSAVHLNEPGPHRRIAFVVRPNYAGVANVQLLATLFKKQLNASRSKK